jgi:hypothetical protein
MLVKFVRQAAIAAGAAAVVAAVTAAPLEAQVALCGKRNAIVESLKSKYKEDRQAIGIVGANGVVELYISEAGTWTMLVTSQDGRTCIMAAGHSWDGKPTLATGTAI